MALCGMKKSFTLIELLVVVAIIAVLVALLLPGLAQARNKAKRLLCQNNMKQVAAGFLMYADTENNGKLPRRVPYPSTGWAFLVIGSEANLAAQWVYPKYVGDPKVFFCPFNMERNAAKDATATTINFWTYTMAAAGQRLFALPEDQKVKTITIGGSSTRDDWVAGGPWTWPWFYDQGFLSWGKDYFNHPDGLNMMYINLTSKWVTYKELGRNSNYCDSFLAE
jgi:prepilin-type N-terminal cleavage/methylation domain-containing protein